MLTARILSGLRLVGVSLVAACLIAGAACRSGDEDEEADVETQMPAGGSAAGASWTHFTNANSVTGVLPAADGKTLWCSTRGGVLVFDKRAGKFTEKYTTAGSTLADSDVRGVVPGIDGAVWFYTEGGGVTRHTAGVWRTYDASTEFAANRIGGAFHDTNGDTYFAHYDSEGGYSVYENATWKTMAGRAVTDLALVAQRTPGASGLYATTIMRDDTGDLWLGTYGAGLAQRRGAVWTVYSKREGLPDNSILALAWRPARTLAATTKGLVVKASADETWRPYPGAPSEVTENAVYSLGFDGKGRLWCGTAHAAWYEAGRGEWVEVKPSAGFQRGPVRAVVADGEDVWLGVDGEGGLWRHRAGRLEQFRTDDKLSGNEVEAVAAGQGNIVWFGTANSGLDLVNRGKWTHYGPPAQPLLERITGLVFAKNALWVSTLSGLGRFADGRWKFFTDELPDTHVRCVTVAPDGAVWIGTALGGAGRYDGSAWTFYGEDKLGSNNVTDVAVGRGGTAWFATDSGLAQLTDGRWRKWLPSQEGLNTDFVRAVAVDSAGGVWVGTDQGLATFEMRDRRWQVYTAAESSLAGDKINDIYCAPDGTVWIATDAGVNYFKDGKWWTIRGTDGLISNRVRAIAPDPSGGLWFATSAGVSYLKQ